MINTDLRRVSEELAGKPLSDEEAKRLTIAADHHELTSLLADGPVPVPSQEVIEKLKDTDGFSL